MRSASGSPSTGINVLLFLKHGLDEQLVVRDDQPVVHQAAEALCAAPGEQEVLVFVVVKLDGKG